MNLLTGLSPNRLLRPPRHACALSAVLLAVAWGPFASLLHRVEVPGGKEGGRPRVKLLLRTGLERPSRRSTPEKADASNGHAPKEGPSVRPVAPGDADRPATSRLRPRAGDASNALPVPAGHALAGIETRADLMESRTRRASRPAPCLPPPRGPVRTRRPRAPPAV